LLGGRRQKANGKFRYAKAGELLVRGETLQSSATLTNVDMATVGAAKGDAYVSITSVGTEAANTYAEGFIYVNKGGALGLMHGVLSHATLTGGAGDLIYVVEPDGLGMAVTNGDESTLIQNPYKGVITAPATTESASPCGVACEPIASASYGWVQTGGAAAVLATNGADGDAIAALSGTGGRAEACGADTEFPIGVVIAPSTAAGEGAAVLLTID
jgi:hypothetical protein